jgi:hypothetical protein
LFEIQEIVQGGCVVFKTEIPFEPSINGTQGMVIITREKIGIGFVIGGGVYATVSDKNGKKMFYDGDTPLIAAMRCFVISKLGDEVEIPKEFL